MQDLPYADRPSDLIKSSFIECYLRLRLRAILLVEAMSMSSWFCIDLIINCPIIILLNIQYISFNNVNKFALTKLKSEAGYQYGTFGAVERNSGFNCNSCSVWNRLQPFCANWCELINGICSWGASIAIFSNLVSGANFFILFILRDAQLIIAINLGSIPGNSLLERMENLFMKILIFIKLLFFLKKSSIW